MVVGVTDSAMSAVEAAELVVALGDAGVRVWVIGGWGIDSLVGSQTRDHHDLDLLVQVEDLPTLDQWLRRNEFARMYVWGENEPVCMAGASFDTAFVEGHADGRELDVHGVKVDAHGCPQLATKDPWNLPSNAFSGVGSLDGRRIPCVTRTAQVLMHRGYELPQKHRADLALLERMSNDDG